MFKSQSQTNSIIDTIEVVRTQAYAKNFAEADRLLTLFTANKNDVNAFRLHAQVLYWMKDFKSSQDVLKKALSVFPDAYAVKLDYGRLLFEMGKLNQARLLLDDYKLNDTNNAEVNILLAHINFRSGNIKTANERVKDVLKLYPDNQMALSIQRDINYNTSPYVTLHGTYHSDDQPLKSSGFEVESGVYKSWLLSPVLNMRYNHFTLPDSVYNSLWLQASDKITFGSSGFSLNMTGGIFKHHTNNDKTRLTASVLLAQKLTRYISIEASTAKRPYQYSSASVRIPVMQAFSGVALRLNKSDLWLGRSAYEIQKFEDNNKIKTAYLWFLAPIVNSKGFTLHAGYGFNHSNADRNTFTSVKSLNAIISSYTITPVQGYYNPYFTPKNQTVHSVLVSVKTNLSKSVVFSSRFNLGLSSKADNPYLYLNKTTAGTFFVDKGYSTISYSPVDFYSQLQVNVSSKATISGSYSYFHPLFYKSHQAEIQLKYLFSNEKN